MDAARIDFAGTVRPLRAADLPSIQRILELWVRDTPSSPPLADEIAGHLARMSNSLVEERGARYLVAVTETGEIVGVVGMRPPDVKMLPFTSTERPVEMINAYVDPHHRKGCGVGTVLVRELERLARESGFTEMVLNSGPRYRSSGWEFFDKLGYERRGLAHDLYGEGVHAPVWRKIL
jgi:ribosomal protein S18 acetylase RimI-like enzyme